jgi:hypothetical protein
MLLRSTVIGSLAPTKALLHPVLAYHSLKVSTASKRPVSRFMMSTFISSASNSDNSRKEDCTHLSLQCNCANFALFCPDIGKHSNSLTNPSSETSMEYKPDRDRDEAMIDALYNQHELHSHLSHPMIDSHNHLHFYSLSSNSPTTSSIKVLEHAFTRGIVAHSVCATSPERDWERVSQLFHQFPERVKPSFGLHPWHIQQSHLPNEEQTRKCN